MRKERKRQFLAFLLALVMVIGQMAGTPGLTVRAEENEEGGNEENLGSIALGIEFDDGSEYRQKNNYTWLFLGESMTLSVDDTEVQGDISEYVLVWEYGRMVENVYAPYETAEDIPFSRTESDTEGTVTITAGTQPGTATYGVRAYLYANADDYTSGGENALLTAEIDFDIVAGGYDYWFPTGDGISQLPEWDYGIDKYFTCYVDNTENPYGSEMPTEITAITVVNGQDETSTDPVVTVNAREDNSGWDLHMNQMGHAVGTITYQLVDGSNNTATHKFDIWVSDSVYGIDASTDTGVWQLLPGDSIEVTPRVWLDCYNEEQGYFQGNIDDVTLAWAYGTNDTNYAEAFEVSNSGNILTITAKEGSAERDLKLELRAYVSNANGGTDEVVYGEWWINSWEHYQRMEITSTVNTVLGIGQQTTVNTALWDYCVDYTSTERKMAITEGYQLRWEWDEQAIQITDANGKVLSNDDSTGTAPFTIKKLKNWGTNADLIFEIQNDDGGYNEVQRKSWYFEELNYDVWFNGLRGEDYSWTYVSEDNTSGEEYGGILLYRGNLDARADRTCTVEWILGIWDEAQEETIPLELGDIQDIYTIRWAEDGDKIILQAEKLKRAIVEQFGDEYGLSMDDNLWVHVETKVRVGEGELRQQVAGCGTNIEIRKEVYEYQFPIEDGMGMLPNWSRDINKYFNCSVENADNPDGGNVSVEITEISVANAEDEETTEAVVTCTPWEDGNGWNMNANTYGHAVATITYKLADGSGETATRSFDIWVSDCVNNVDVSSDTNEFSLVPGEALNLTPKAWADHYDEENGEWSENLENATLEWKYGENDSNYEEAFKVEEKDGKLYIEALNNSTGRNLQVQLRVFMPDENGDSQEIAYGEWWINSSDFYYTIKADEVDSELAVGATCQIAPSLYLHNLEGGTINVKEITENFQYRVEWDTNSVKVTDANNKTLENGSDTGTAPFTIEKLQNWGTEITIIAELADLEGNYSEETRRSWWLNEQNYDISFNNLREEGNTWIFAAEDTKNDEAYAVSEEDEAYTLELNTENLDKKATAGYEIKWFVEVEGSSQDSNVKVTNEHGEYKVSEDGTSITFYAGKLKDTLQSVLGRAEDDNEFMNVTVRAAVFVGVGDNKEECAGCFTNLDILLPEYSIEEQSIGDTLPQDVLSYEDGKIGVYIKNKDYPYGETVMFDITGIETNNVDDSESVPEVFKVEHEEDSAEWKVTAAHYGGGYITYHTHNESIGDKDFAVEIWVKSDVYRIHPYMDTGSSHLLPGASAQICYDIEHGHYDETTQEAKWETVEQSDKYRVSFKDYDSDLITVDEEGKIIANADGKYWGTDVRVVLEVSMADGDDWSEERSECVWVDVTECYYQIFAEQVIGEPGEKVNIPVVFKKFDLEHPEGVEMEGVQYRIEENTDLLTADETGTGVTISKDAATVEDELFGKLVVVVADFIDEWSNEIHEEMTTGILICAHNYQETGRKNPSCTVAGSVTYKCSKCGTGKSETLTASGHSMKTIAAEAATCTTAGNNKYYYCKTCKKYFKDPTGTKVTTVAAETLTASGHSMKTIAAKAATCTTAGNNKYYYCKTCKKYFKDSTGKKATTVKAETIKAKGHDYKLKVTRATLEKNGSSVMKCSCGAEKKGTKTVIARPTTFKLSKTTYTYTGKTQKQAPTLTVKDSKGKKISSKNYTVTGLKKYKYVGTYTVKVKFKGNYSGTKTLTFSIVPKTTSISEVTAAKKGFTVKWKKQTDQTKGYQIQYSTSKNFKKAKTETISRNKTTSKKITNLTAKKEYYVRIRTYKTVKVNGKSTKLYSGWSDYVTVTTKK